MTTSIAVARTGVADTAVLWINRALELLWLMALMLVPLAFLGRDIAVSEAVISYVEVPKVTLLRSLAGLMAILWLVEWGFRGQWPWRTQFWLRNDGLGPRQLMAALAAWLRAQPTRWLILAVWFYLGTTLLSTMLSGSFRTSLWGEIPGQDSYSAYTIGAYLILFGVVTTHLKTRNQLWRLVGAIVVMGTLVSGYTVLQHYGHDIFNLGEVTGGGEGRATSTAGNALFASAIMLLTIPISLMAAIITLPEPEEGNRGIRKNLGTLLLVLGIASAGAFILMVQLTGITFTFSRGAWLGVILALGLFVLLPPIFVGWAASRRAVLVLALTAVFLVAVLHWQGTVSISGLGRWFAPVAAFSGLIGLGAVLAYWRLFARLIIPLAVAGGLLVGGFLLVNSIWGGDEPLDAGSGLSTSSEEASGGQVLERFTSIKTEILSGGLTGRVDTWKNSWQLVRDHPWFEFDSLSLPWLRPLIGYGPDLFRYTYLLVSPPEPGNRLPFEPDHAHNYFVHQTVEQGFLGLLSSLGLFAAVLLAGGFQLIKGRGSYSQVHKLILVGLLAMVAGRFLEQMVGLARASDLTIFWVLLAVFAALPGVMQDQPVEQRPAPTPGNRSRRARAIHRSASSGWSIDANTFLRLALVAWLVGGILTLTWLKSVNYVRAAVAMGDGQEHFIQGELQAALADLNRAIALAPDVSPYYNHRASVYLAYQLNDGIPPEQGCSLRSNESDVPYKVCLAGKALESNLEGARQNPFYFRSMLALANSAYNINANDEAVKFYRQSLQMVPGSWPIRNELAGALLEAGQPSEALQVAQESLAITGDNSMGAVATFYTGIAYRDLGDSQRSVVALERSVELGLPGPTSRQAREILAAPFVQQGEEHSGLGRYGRAIEAYTEAIRINPKDAASYLSRAAAYNELGQYELAIEDYRHALTEQQARLILAAPYVQQGQEFIGLGQYDRAINSYTEAIRLNPQDAESYLYRALAYSELGRYELAAEDYEHAASLNLVDALNYANQGDAYMQLAEYGLAIQDFTEAIRLEPELISAYGPDVTGSGIAGGSFTAQRFGAGGNSALYDNSRIPGADPNGHAETNNTVYDFGRGNEVHIRRVVIKNSPNLGVINSGTWKLDYSDDGLSWIEAGQFLMMPGRGNTHAHDFAPTGNHRYWRLGSTDGSSPGDTISIEEIAMLEAVDDADIINPRVAEYYLNRGISYSQLARPDLAILDYEDAISLNPQLAAAHISRGDAYTELGQYEVAIRDYDQAISVISQPDRDPLIQGLLALAYNGRGGALIGLDLYDRAIQEFDEAISLDLGLGEAYSNRGHAYIIVGQHALAVQDYNQAIRLEPQVALSYVNRGDSYFELGQYDRAIEDYDEAIRIDPRIAQAHAGRGHAYFQMGEYRLAITDFDQALGLGRRDARTYFGRGSAYNAIGEHQRAIDDYNAALRLQPEDARSLAGRGNAFLQLSVYDQAILDYAQAITLDASYAEAAGLRGGLALAYDSRGRARLSAEQGRYDEAIQDFDQAILLAPDFARAYLDRGKAYTVLGQYELAIHDYDRAISLDSQFARDPLTRERLALAYNGRGKDLSRIDLHNRAIQDFGQAISLDPQFAEAYGNRGQAKLSLERYAEAIQDFDQAIRLDPGIALGYGPDVTGSGTAGGSFTHYRSGTGGNAALYDNSPTPGADPIGHIHSTNTTYDFGEGNQVHIRRVIIKNSFTFGIMNPGEWSLDYSDDGLSWERGGRFTMAVGQGNTHVHDFPATGNHRYWRLAALDNAPGVGSIYIEEIEMQEVSNDFVLFSPQVAQSYVNRGNSYSELGQYDRAIEDFNEAIRIDPRTAQAHAGRGQAFLQLGEYRLAVSDFDQALNLDSRDARTYINRGNAYNALGEHLLAVDDYNAALHLEPEGARSLAGRGNAFLQLEEYDQAILDYERAITLDAGYAESVGLGQALALAYDARGRVSREQVRYDDALQDFDQAILLAPDLAQVYLSRGDVYHQLGQFSMAIQDYEQAILLDSQLAQDLNIRSNLALAYVRRGEGFSEDGQYHRAILDFDQAINLDPELAEAYGNRGQTYNSLGQFAQVIEDYTQAIRLDPGIALSYGSDVTGSGTAGGSFSYHLNDAAGNAALYDNSPAPAADRIGHIHSSNTTYDFGEGNRVHVRRIIIKNGSNFGIANPGEWSLDYSDDGMSWVRSGLFPMVAGQGNTHVHDFPATGNHRFWRLAAIDNAPGAGSIFIEEIEMLEENNKAALIELQLALQ